VAPHAGEGWSGDGHLLGEVRGGTRAASSPEGANPYHCVTEALLHLAGFRRLPLPGSLLRLPPLHSQSTRLPAASLSFACPPPVTQAAQRSAGERLAIVTCCHCNLIKKYFNL